MFAGIEWRRAIERELIDTVAELEFGTGHFVIVGRDTHRAHGRSGRENRFVGRTGMPNRSRGVDVLPLDRWDRAGKMSPREGHRGSRLGGVRGRKQAIQ